jgi:hypothetical protein
MLRLTRVFSVFWAYVVVTRIQYVLVHERSARRNLSEKRDLDRLPDLDSLALLYEDLASVLAAVLAVERRNTVLFWVVTFFEGLQGSHEVVATGDAVCDNTLCDTGCDGTLDDGGDGVHGPDYFGLELRRDVKLDLLEEVF